MILVNEIYRLGKVGREDYKNLILLISPFAPHIANELFEVMKFGTKIEDATWPVFDESKLVKNEIELPVQINGKVRGVITVSVDAGEDEVLAAAKENKEISKYLTGNIIKVIFVPKKILNIIVKIVK